MTVRLSNEETSLSSLTTVANEIHTVLATNYSKKTIGLERARWSFTIGSSLSLLSAVLLFFGFVSSGSTKLSEETTSPSEKQFFVVKTFKLRLLNALFLLFSALLTVLWAFASGILTQYFQTFAIVGLQWSTTQSSYLNGILGAGQLVGSLTAILMSKINSQHTILVIGVALGIWTAGVILMLLTSIGLIMGAGIVVGASLAGKNYQHIYIIF